MCSSDLAEARVSAMLDACPDVMVVKDSARRYRMVNRAFCERARTTPAQVIGRTNEEVFGDVLPPHVREAEEACSLTGKVQVYEFRTGLDSVSSWYEAVAVPLGEGAARDGSIVITVRDVTARKEARGDGHHGFGRSSTEEEHHASLSVRGGHRHRRSRHGGVRRTHSQRLEIGRAHV